MLRNDKPVRPLPPVESADTTAAVTPASTIASTSTAPPQADSAQDSLSSSHTLSLPSQSAQPGAAPASGASAPTLAPGVVAQAFPAISPAYTRWRDAVRDYETDFKRWKEVQGYLAKVHKYLIGHIDTSLMYLIRGQTTPYDIIVALKAALSPTTVDFANQVLRKYNQARIYSKRQDFEDWTRRFQEAYDHAVSVNLPETQGWRPYKDLLKAFKQIDPHWTAVVEVNLEAAELASPGHPGPEWDLRRQLNACLRHYRQHNTNTNTKASYNAFAAAARTPTLDGAQPTTPRSKRKPRRPCLCGDIHFFRECPYIVKDLQ